MVKLHAPATHSSCSFDGDEYKVEDGMVTVPSKAVSHLVSHGFSTTKIEAAAKPPMPNVSSDEHETVKSDLSAAEQLIKELQSKLDAQAADVAKARKANVSPDGKKTGPDEGAAAKAAK